MALRKEGVLNPNPRRQFLKDLEDLIKEKLKEGYRPLVMVLPSHEIPLLWYAGDSEATERGDCMVGSRTQEQENVSVRSETESVAQGMRKAMKKQQQEIDVLQVMMDRLLKAVEGERMCAPYYLGHRRVE